MSNILLINTPKADRFSSSTTDATEYLNRKLQIIKITIIREYNNEMKENSYIIVVTKIIIFVVKAFSNKFTYAKNFKKKFLPRHN